MCSVFTGDPGPRPEKMLQKIECPVLVAWGDSDPWTPIDGSIGSFFQKQAKEQENIEFVPLANTGKYQISEGTCKTCLHISRKCFDGLSGLRERIAMPLVVIHAMRDQQA